MPETGQNGVYQPRYGADTSDSFVTPLGLGVVIIAILLLLVLPRKYRVIPLFVVTYFVTFGQNLVILGLHFPMIRVVILFGWLRVVWSYANARSEVANFRFNSIDRIFTAWAISNALVFCLLWRDSQSIINRCGFLWTTLGAYFLLRFLCQDREDVDRMIRVFAFVSIVIAACMVREQLSGQNLFSMFGGVPEMTMIREGKLRSQAAFGNAILAGCFGASLVPLFVWLWQSGRYRLTAAAGLIASTVITLTSSSSTPVMSYMAGLAGLCMWPMRKGMRVVRWAIVVTLVSLHLVMKAPVWALISRVDVLSGSSYQRFILVDSFIRHFWDWWLIGYRYPENWGWFTGDLDNEFVLQGTFGGLLTFVLFVGLIVRSFSKLGIARSRSSGLSEKRLWAMGCAVLATAAAFGGIDYFDQSVVTWYSLLAMICVVTAAPVMQVVPNPLASESRALIGSTADQLRVS